MTVDTMVTIGIAAVGWGGTVIGFVFWFGRFTQTQKEHGKTLERLTEIMWHRSTVAFVRKGYGEMTNIPSEIPSPRLTDLDLKASYAEITAELHTWYKRYGYLLSPYKQYEMVGSLWGAWMANNVCLKHAMDAGECILAAIAIAKECAL